MSPFYTKTGDDGTTGLLGSSRVKKSDLRIEVLGTLDELSASLGLARSLSNTTVNDELKAVQVCIYQVMSEVAATDENVERFQTIGDVQIQQLEEKIEKYENASTKPSEFILPGDTAASATLSVARTIARRAERRLVELQEHQKTLRPVLLKYLNRLSSFLYILEIFSVQTETQSTPSLAKKIGRASCRERV